MRDLFKLIGLSLTEVWSEAWVHTVRVATAVNLLVLCIIGGRAVGDFAIWWLQ